MTAFRKRSPLILFLQSSRSLAASCLSSASLRAVPLPDSLHLKYLFGPPLHLHFKLGCVCVCLRACARARLCVCVFPLKKNLTPHLLSFLSPRLSVAPSGSLASPLPLLHPSCLPALQQGEKMFILGDASCTSHPRADAHRRSTRGEEWRSSCMLNAGRPSYVQHAERKPNPSSVTATTRSPEMHLL